MHRDTRLACGLNRSTDLQGQKASTTARARLLDERVFFDQPSMTANRQPFCLTSNYGHAKSRRRRPHKVSMASNGARATATCSQALAIQWPKLTRLTFLPHAVSLLYSTRFGRIDGRCPPASRLCAHGALWSLRCRGDNLNQKDQCGTSHTSKLRRHFILAAQ